MRKKPSREKGKLKFSRYFQEFKEGDKVAFVRELSVTSNVPDRYQGRTGTVEFRRGKAYSVKIKDLNKEKSFLIEPIHLRKIKNSINI
ncbi:MAG: 50S ribosomal protein L21e [Nanoarchaeota archaeon]